MRRPAPFTTARADDTRLSARSANIIRKASQLRPRLALILGSGFQSFLEAPITKRIEIPYDELPGFPAVSVKGHAGVLVIGELAGVPMMALSGRAHYYEGHSFGQVTFAVRALRACGIDHLLLTNAAGGINLKFKTGEFMRLEDHINFMGDNPLRGVTGGSDRFVDMTAAYDPELNRLLDLAAKRAKVRLHSGVYLAVPGPSYETPAEIRAFQRLGADAVGMSTVPEALMARYLGMAVAAVSCITNLAAGCSGQKLSHSDVLSQAGEIKGKVQGFLGAFIQAYGQSQSSQTH